MIEAMRATPMNPNKALWEKGGFTRIAQTMRESGEAYSLVVIANPRMSDH
jgi:hypothetical protein